MARMDGEDWLEGRPVVSDEGSEDSRRVRSPKWWLAGVATALLIGLAYEAARWALGEGAISLSAVLDTSMVAFATLAVTTLLSAWYARRA